MNTSHSVKSLRILGLAAAIGPIGFVAGIAAAGFAYPRYSHIDQMISELGGADATHPAIQNWNFILFGLTAVGLALALVLDNGRVFLGAVLLAALGILGTATEGVAHCDSGCLGKTSEGAVHLAAGMIGFLSGVAAVFLLSRRWKDDPRWADHATFTKWCARAALGGLVLFIASGAANGTEIDGLAQRLFAAPLLVFASVTGWKLFRRPGQLASRTEHNERAPEAIAAGRAAK
jgi:hypothetical membrane protein